MNLVYSKEPIWFAILLIFSALFWLVMTVCTLGIVWLYVLLLQLFSICIRSAYFSHLRGNAIRITDKQFPELHAQIVKAAGKLQMSVPECYIRQQGGILNTLAAHFLMTNFLVLNCDIVEAVKDKPELASFYIGHELGHIKRRHWFWQMFFWPAAWLPIVGSAYHRAREYTCDLHGLACVNNADEATQGLLVLAAGKQLWKNVNVEELFLHQLPATGNFWMSFNEYTSDYPWLVKRICHIRNATGQITRVPSRSVLAFLLSLFTPRFGMGLNLGPIGLIYMAALIGILASIAIPAYHDYRQRTKFNLAYQETLPLRTTLTEYVAANGTLPEDKSFPTDLAKVRGTMPQIKDISWEGGGLVMILQGSGVENAQMNLYPQLDEAHQVIGWRCATSSKYKKVLPKDCRGDSDQKSP